MLQIIDDIIDVFCTDGQTYGAWCDTAFAQFLFIHLRMSVDAGWITRDFTSATLASSENSSRDSVNFCASPVHLLLRK